MNDPSTRRRRTPARLWALIGALSVAGAALTASSWSADPVTRRAAIAWPALALTYFLAESCVLHVYARHHAHTFSLSEIPLVVGLMFVAPRDLVAARLLGSALALLVVRRQPFVKAAFNLSYFVLETAGSVIVYRWVLGGADPITLWGAAAALVTTSLFLLVGATAISLVIAASERAPVQWPWAMMSSVGVVNGLLSSNLGMIAAAALAANDQSGVLLLPAAAALGFAYNVHARLRQTSQGLAQLYDTTRSLGSALHTGDVREVILAEACNLLRADVAEITVRRPGEDAWRVVRTEDHVDLDAPLTDELLRTRATLVAVGGRILPDPAAVAALGEPGWTSAMLVPLELGDGSTGTLVVANPMSDVDAFRAADLRLLETFATHAAVSLLSGNLVEELRTEASRRHHQALHDALTGLPNRTKLQQHLSSSLARIEDDGTLAVLLIDLDGFKEVNDTLGHHRGDELLQGISARIVDELGDRAFVARLGGDEFAAVVADRTPAGLLAMAERLEARVLEPFRFGELIFEVGASIGIASAPEHGTNATTLLQRADVAMYAAKRRGETVELYNPDADDYTPQRLTLAAELRRAIDRGEVLVEYQPKAALGSGDVRGVEALARWHHPKHGFVPPDRFVPVAEAAGLMRPLTEHVLDVALRQVVRWNEMGLDITVSVNLSPRNLADAHLADMIAARLEATGARPSSLVIEITENTLIADPARTVGTLNRLSDMGVAIAIDDFGTGYSSLSYLQRLPVNELKIDKSFVLNMTADKSDAVIVRSTIELGHSLGLQVTAEGVEDGATWQMLAALGCDEAQGYHLQRPAPSAVITRWLVQHRAERAAMAALFEPIAPAQPTSPELAIVDTTLARGA